MIECVGYCSLVAGACLWRYASESTNCSTGAQCLWGYCGIWSGSKLFPAPSSRGDERVVSVDEQVAGVGESSVGELCCVDCAGLRLDAEGVLWGVEHEVGDRF